MSRWKGEPWTIERVQAQPAEAAQRIEALEQNQRAKDCVWRPLLDEDGTQDGWLLMCGGVERATLDEPRRFCQFCGGKLAFTAGPVIATTGGE